MKTLTYEELKKARKFRDDLVKRADALLFPESDEEAEKIYNEMLLAAITYGEFVKEKRHEIHR